MFALEDGSPCRLTVRITNKDHFQSTAWLQLRWRLLADGLPLPVGQQQAGSNGWVALDHAAVAPQAWCSRTQACCIIESCLVRQTAYIKATRLAAVAAAAGML